MRWPWKARHDAGDRELDEEIRSHFEMAVADRVARGESPEAALAAVRREFGNVGHVKEVTHETWGGLWLERLTQDVRYALRSLRRASVFAAVLVASVLVASRGMRKRRRPPSNSRWWARSPQNSLMRGPARISVSTTIRRGAWFTSTLPP